MTSLLVALAFTQVSGVVVRVADGDTVRVLLAGDRVESVRVLGIDTPEFAYFGCTCDQPGAAIAKRAMVRMVLGKRVELEADLVGPDRDDTDSHRLLRYLRVDGRDIGAQLVATGRARADAVHAHERLPVYCAIEEKARVARRGIWSYRRNPKPSQCAPTKEEQP